MASILDRLFGGRTAARREEKSMASLKTLFAISNGAAEWSGGGYAGLSRQGMVNNPVVYRCVRLVAESVARIPLDLVENGESASTHPLIDLVRQPNAGLSGTDLIERIASYLQLAGDAYVEAVILGGEVRGLYPLRPDRVRMVPGADGWPRSYEYAANGKVRLIAAQGEPMPPILHMALFHPLDDHDGLAPLDAARMSLDIHNAASAWNKALLDNAARPSGALVYTAGDGTLSQDQFDRLKSELAEGFEGALNAGRPMVLEGGLDWKSLSMSPKDMDFIEAKHVAAREIALAFGVPPMLLGIPGDNTYANFAEANRALWRNTVVPMSLRIAASLTGWLRGGFAGTWQLVPNLEKIEALADDRAKLWARVSDADFLDDDEKRQLLGIPRRAAR